MTIILLLMIMMLTMVMMTLIMMMSMGNHSPNIYGNQILYQ